MRASVTIPTRYTATALTRISWGGALPRLHDVDLVVADPSFAWYRNGAAPIAELLRLGARALAPAGRSIIRGERGADLPEMPAGLVERERRAYGRSWLALLQRDAGPAGG